MKGFSGLHEVRRYGDTFLLVRFFMFFARVSPTDHSKLLFVLMLYSWSHHLRQSLILLSAYRVKSIPRHSFVFSILVVKTRVSIFDVMQQERAWLLTAWNPIKSIRLDCSLDLVRHRCTTHPWNDVFGMQHSFECFRVNLVFLYSQGPVDNVASLRKTLRPL